MPDYGKNDIPFHYRGYTIERSEGSATVKMDGVSMTEEDSFEDAKDWIDEKVKENSKV